MNTLKNLQLLIEKGVNDLKFPLQPAELYEPITYILALGGKRLRPALLLMACDMFGGDTTSAVPPALAIEVFHNFTLVHDDIMDNAPLRRGRATVHEKWNTNVGILSGDVMLVEAYKLIMQVENSILRDVLDIFNTTAVGVCEGQQFDMNFERQTDVQIDAYLNMIRLKTAVLLGGALKIGALIGGAAAQDAELLYTFGEQLGIAFQLQDDILDVYGDPDKFGKQVGGDIISNKKTYLLIKAIELAQGQQALELLMWLNNDNCDNLKKITAVTNIYNQLQVRQYAEQAMHEFINKAFEALHKIKLPFEQKQQLHDFAEGLMMREN
ncbi:polyprenyl synthetase family protein [Mucilaginibacter lacusdianchii]|uniref:polyprenyl synthetase family protein n=1 Tax=Mucilaginibacter lacusdianchii TaxID=2684211 RepID=UPI00131BDE41|nr:polyprenyl synthetase family protein [Mucilaginibacter sp. JXJ CY 39]